MKKSIDSKEIGVFKKTDNAYIKVTLNKWRGVYYIDIREYLESEEYSGPTKKGVTFRCEDWENFKDLMAKLDSAIQNLC